jgi:recombination protein RecA
MASNLDSVLKNISKKYGNGIAKFGADDLSIDGVLSLGSPMIDYCLYGGIPEGRIIEFSGAEGSGKTSTAFLVAASFQKEELKRHPIGEEWELNGEPHVGPRSIIFLDNEGTLDPVWAKNFGYDLSEEADVKTIVIRPEGQNAEEIFDMALDCLKTGDVGLLIFDSIATLVPAQIADESMEKYQMGGIAKSLTRFANTALGLLRKYKATLVAINQVRENMSGYGNPITTPGGRSWKHACSFRLMFKRGDFFDEDGNKLTTTAESPAGHIVNVAVLKTKTSKWDRKGGSYRLNYTRGIDILADTIEAALHFGLIDNSTQGTFKIIDPKTGEVKLDANGNEIKIRGKLNVKGYFEEHMEEWKDLYDNVYEKIREKESPFIKSFEDLLNLQTREAFSEDELNMAVNEEGAI